LIKKLSVRPFLKYKFEIVLNPYHPEISLFLETEKIGFRKIAENIGATTCFLTFKERELTIEEIKAGKTQF
tara:strand:+ start:36 stop:248 length:213 start_codon:yes stop_codon:yes gene_type:complete